MNRKRSFADIYKNKESKDADKTVKNKKGIHFDLEQKLDNIPVKKTKKSKESTASDKEDEYKPEVELLTNLFTFLEGDYDSMMFDERAPGLHASSLYKTCGRRVILSALLDLLPEKETQKAGNKFTQDLGHAMHQWWQERYLGPSGLLIGKWICDGCSTLYEGKMPLDCSCGKDWRHVVRYKETFVNLEDIKVCGSCDGILLDPKTGKKRVFEFKSKSTNQYKALIGPTYDHVIQTHVYMMGLGLDEAIIVYADKGKQCSWTFKKGVFTAGKPNIKSYLVKFNEALWQEIVKTVREYHLAKAMVESEVFKSLKTNKNKAAQSIKTFSRICASPNCEMAKNCHVSDACFEMPPHDSIEV